MLAPPRGANILSPPHLFPFLFLSKSTQAIGLPLPFRESMGQICCFTGLHRLPYATDKPSFISYLDVDKPTIWLETVVVICKAIADFSAEQCAVHIPYFAFVGPIPRSGDHSA